MQVSKQCFTWLLYLLPYLAAAQSPYWQRTYNQPFRPLFHDATIAFDGSGFTMTGAYSTTPNGFANAGFIFKADRQGETVWGYRDTLIHMRLSPTRDSGYLSWGETPMFANPVIQKFNKFGVQQWRKTYSRSVTLISAVIQTSDLGYMMYGSRRDSLHLTKLDAAGNSLWTQSWKAETYNGFTSLGGQDLIELPDGGFLIDNSSRYVVPDSSSALIRTDALGNRLWRKRLLGANFQFKGRPCLVVQDGKITFFTRNDQMGFVNQMDMQGNLLQSIPIPAFWIGSYNLTKRRLGGFWLTFAQDTVDRPVHLFRLDANGVPVTRKRFPESVYFSGMHEASDSTLFFYGVSNGATMMVTDTNGRVYRNLIRGRLSSSCTNVFANWAVSATRADGTVFHARTDPSSAFEIVVDTGNYTIRAHPPTADWSSNVHPLSQPNWNRIDTIPLIINCLTSCPNLHVDLTTPLMRRCFPNQHTIRYCNNGTIPATNAYVEVKLDSLLEYLNSSIPLTSRVGQTLRFNLGTIYPNNCSFFTITSRSACGDSTRLGQSLCTSVHIYPDTICTNLPNWTGANLFVSGACERDSVRFTIANLGRGHSSTVRRTVVDNAHLMSSTLINLAANGQQTLRFPANGHTWRVSVEQEPNHPYGNTPTAAIEGCRNNSNTTISTLFLNQLPLDTRNPVQKTVCTTLVGSYDPNDKTSLPVGYGVNRLIEANQDVEYMVRFQNTGTDTAFTVIVKDTLSNLLDALSIQPLASSHRYEWTVLKNNILQFTFPNIQLVDSFHNEPKSHGFIKFHIKQKSNIPLGSTISNQAAIYFDFNAPVITNRTQLTIGKQFIILGVSDGTSPLRMRLVTYPNPTIDHAILEILDGVDDLSNRDFQLLDATGRIVREGNFNGNRYEFSREGLNGGFYFFRVAQQGQLLGTGRIVIQ